MKSAKLMPPSFMVLLFVLSSSLASAQVLSSMSGRVEDRSGAIIPGATVTVTSVETGAARILTTDEAGNYRALSLPVGQYEVRAEKPGFRAVVQKGIHLVVGQQAMLNLLKKLADDMQLRARQKIMDFGHPTRLRIFDGNHPKRRFPAGDRLEYILE